MSIGPVLPVLGRISEIEARFGDARPPAGDDADFDAVFAAVDDAAPGTATTPMERVAASLAGQPTDGSTAALGGALAPFADLLPTSPSGYGHTAAPGSATPYGYPVLQPAPTVSSGYAAQPAPTVSYGYPVQPAPTVSYGYPVQPAPTVSYGYPAVVGTDPAPAAGGASEVPASVPYADLFTDAGRRHDVPPRLLAAVGHVESSYRPDVVSEAGAMGLMQLMPFVAEELGVDAFDPPAAVDGAARLLADHRERFGTWDLALAAYFSGAGAVSRAGNVPPTTRSQHYVEKVLDRMEHM